MSRWRHWQETALIILLLAACSVLAFLQYRWTGEVSRAESDRLRASAAGRLEHLAGVFNDDIRRSVRDFVPSQEEVRRLGREQANAERLKQAAARMERPLFRRIAAAAPSAQGKLQLTEGRIGEGYFTQTDWPESPDWKNLKAELERLVRDERGGGPQLDKGSLLIEVPVFGEDGEVEWMIFELDMDYVTKTWIPELIHTYVNPQPEPYFRIAIRWRTDPSRILFGGKSEAGSKADAETSLFPLRFLGVRNGEGRWLVSLTHADGSIEAAVSASRRRNLGVALVLLMLIAGAGSVLLHYTRKSRQLAAAQFQFFAGISHELRTPLTVIQGAGHNLLSGVVKDEVQRDSYVQAIVKQSAQLNEMVDQILTYSGRGNMPAEAGGSTTLSVAVADAIESAAMELEKEKRSVDVDMPCDLPMVRGDEASLRRAIGNLVINAVRHGSGEISISAVLAGAVVELRVADAGEGITADELKLVFDPFFRGQKARTGRIRGTGLGLSLVKETVEALGGSVSVESGKGKGTVFTLRLPVAA